jgi:glycosyltransferase involved in cell wall biosynthesis
VSVGDLTEARKNLGWETPFFGKAQHIVLPAENWESVADEVLDSSRDAIHVFGGVYAYEKVLYPLRKACARGYRTAVMQEAPHNSFLGFKWWVKEFYLRVVPPLKTRPLAKHNLFALCLSGASAQANSSMRRLGWHEKQIFPFGYFSEEPPERPHSGNASGRRDPMFLCTGYLTQNKGQHVLLYALRLLKNSGLRFSCNITGYGPEEARLRNLSKSLHLDDGVVHFKGVIPTDELQALMQSSDIFVAPGLSEPWGIRINEAIQAGLAVVVSDGIGACELVRVSGGGAIFPSGNPERLASALYRFISEPEKLAECKEHSRKYRQRIHPRVAAEYFAEVLGHTLDPKGAKPTPPWL